MDDYPTVMMDLPTAVRGFTFKAQDGSPVIVLNSRLPREMNRRTYRHEENHILRGDLDNLTYIEYLKEESS